MRLPILYRFFSLFILLSSVQFIEAKEEKEAYSEENYQAYEDYTAVLPIYEEPLPMVKESIPSSTTTLHWVPSNHVRGLNVFGLVPSFNFGVAQAQFDQLKQEAALFEYVWGYRVFSFLNLAFAYENQRMETINFSQISWKFGKKQFKNHAKLAMHTLMFKAYLESPVVLKVDHFFMTPFVAAGAGPGWVQKGVFGVTVSSWEGDFGLRFGATHPAAFLSLIAGCKYVKWESLGHSFAQYLGLRLNF